MEAKARARFVRISPRKARRVIDLIRGQTVAEARRILAFSGLGAARPVHLQWAPGRPCPQSMRQEQAQGILWRR